MPAGSGPDRAVAFDIFALTLTGFAIICFSIRIYTRALLTRAIGSDDFTICFSAVLTVFGVIGNHIQINAGLGHHQTTIPQDKYGLNQKWEYIDWLNIFISFFFIRTSVMLFVLRLLPHFKQWQQKVVYAALFMNFAITLVATVTFGLSCIPLKAAWENGGQQDVPGTRCYSKHRLVVVQQVNGILSCVIDFTTALVPQLLLWKVEMRPRTKYVLDVIFALGLVTGAMSIGRVATTKSQDLIDDSTWRVLPSKWFAVAEEKFGIMFACAPAIRQFFSYHGRTGTFLPSSEHRRPPNEDFKRMRRRIVLRDIFWFNYPSPVGGRILDARPILQRTDSGQLEASTDAEAAAQTSIMDTLETRAEGAICRSGCSSDKARSGASNTHQHPLSTSTAENKRIAGQYQKWGLLGRFTPSNESSNSTQQPFLLDDSALGSSAGE